LLQVEVRAGHGFPTTRLKKIPMTSAEAVPKNGEAQAASRVKKRIFFLRSGIFSVRKGGKGPGPQNSKNHVYESNTDKIPA
jgi:hypothetical protein